MSHSLSNRKLRCGDWFGATQARSSWKRKTGKKSSGRTDVPTNAGKWSEVFFKSTAERYRDVESGARTVLVNSFYMIKQQRKVGNNNMLVDSRRHWGLPTPTVGTVWMAGGTCVRSSRTKVTSVHMRRRRIKCT